MKPVQQAVQKTYDYLWNQAMVRTTENVRLHIASRLSNQVWIQTTAHIVEVRHKVKSYELS